MRARWIPERMTMKRGLALLCAAAMLTGTLQLGMTPAKVSGAADDWLENGIIIDDPDADILYDGDWTAEAGGGAGVDGAYNATRHFGKGTVEFAFEGTAIQWIGHRSTFFANGKADVYLDDELQTEVNLHAHPPTSQLVLFEATGLASGEHEIRIVSKEDTVINVDAFVYTSEDGGTGEGNPESVLVDEDFEGYDIDAAAPGWITAGAHTSGKVQSSPAGGQPNQALLHRLSEYSASRSTTSYSFDPSAGNLRVSVSFLDTVDAGVPEGYGGTTIRLRDGSSDKTALSLTNHFGFKYNVGDNEEGGSFGTAPSLKWDPARLIGQWNTVVIEANIRKHTFSVTLNGETLGTDLAFLTEVDRIDTIAIGRINFAPGDTSIDDLLIEAEEGEGTTDPGEGEGTLPTNPGHNINYFYTFNPVPRLLGDNAVPGGGTLGWSIDVSNTDKGGTAPETALHYAFKIVPVDANPDDYDYIELDTMTEHGVRIARSTRPWDMSAAFSIQTEAVSETKTVHIWAYVRDRNGTWENKAPYALNLTIVGRNDARLAAEQDPELLEAGAVDHNIIALHIQEGEVAITGQVPYTFAAGDYVDVKARDDREIKRADNSYAGKLAVDNNNVFAAIGDGEEERYVAVPGDRIVYTGSGERPFDLHREGSVAGTVRMVNPKVWVPESVEGKAVNRFALDKPGTFSVSTGGEEVEVAAVHRKEKVNNKAVTDNGYTTEHWVFLELAENLQEGAAYTIALGNELYLAGELLNDAGNAIAYTHRSKENRSDAIHATHTGFKPEDGVKRALLSIWLGSGGEHAYEETAFHLIDAETKAIAYTGDIGLVRAFDEEEVMSPNSLPYENTSRTNVYELDFSEFKKEGRYLVHIEGIGVSYPFVIGDDVWEDAFRVSVNGLYYNRSGLAIDHNGYERPRSYHPEDGVEVYQSTVGLVETGNGLDASGAGEGNFNQLVETKTEHKLRANAVWGGYYDAGDWDKRIQHLFVTRSQLELMLMNPGAYDEFDAQLPDSALVFNHYTEDELDEAGLSATDISGIPDLLAESLWNLDFYRRLQVIEGDWIPNGSDWLGGVRGGIEATDHPAWGEASWQDSLVLMTYAPDAWSSYVYAGTAARTAHVLQGLGKAKLAGLYGDSAEAAYEYAERTLEEQSEDWGSYVFSQVVSEKAYAEVELYRLTGESQYHEAFKATMSMGDEAGLYFDKTDKQEDSRRTWLYNYHTAIFGYILLPAGMTDANLVQLFESVIVGYDPDARKAYGSADHAVAYIERNTWGASMWDEGVPLLGFLSPFATPHADAIVRAHYITGDNKYRNALIKTSQFGLGVNQDNMTMTTGLGYEYPKNTLHLESRQTGQSNPPGITVYGSFKLDTLFGWPIGSPNFAYPNMFDYETFAATGNKGLSEWPTAESFLDIFLYPAMLEWTVQQTMGPTAYTWGYLSATENKDEDNNSGPWPYPGGQVATPEPTAPPQGFTIEPASASDLPAGVAGLPKNRPLFRVALFDGSEPIQGTSDKTIKVIIPYKLSRGESSNRIVAYWIGDDGKTSVISMSEYNRETGELVLFTNASGWVMVIHSAASFDDMARSEWAREAVEYLAAREIVFGIGNSEFGPAGTLTREAFVTMLARAFDLAADSDAASFPDVAEGKWYSESVAAARQLGIVNGYGDGSFGVGQSITREEMATILFRTLAVLGLELPSASNAGSFADGKRINPYAMEGIMALRQAGLIAGVGGNAFAPDAASTRAQAAQLLYNSISLLWNVMLRDN